MRRIALWLVSTTVVMVLLFSYHTSTSSVIAGQIEPNVGPGTPGIVGGADPTPPATPRPHTTSTASPAPSGTRPLLVNGSVAQTRWGPVQVQVSIAGTAITDVTALVYPSGNGRDGEINSYALPRLRQEALQAQSAQISGVSGATVTSDGYRESLQAALDAAHFTG